MSSPGIAVLDFDGVICDSIDECLVASFHAYYDLQGKAAPAGGPAAAATASPACASSSARGRTTS